MSIDDIKELVRWRDKADELATLLEQYSIELQQMRAATKTIERDEARRERDDAQREVARLNALLSSVTAENQYRAQREACALQDWQALRAECDEARADAASSLAMAKIADAKHDQKCAEVDMLRGFGCMEDGDGPCGVCRECFYRHGYRRGAEAMREACAAALMADGLVLSRERAANVVRALPIPEES